MNEPADAELRYLRAQLDELGAENMKLAHRGETVRRELEIRRRAFSLLARLTHTLGPHAEIAPALGAVLPIVEAELGVQRAVALRRAGSHYVPVAWTGFPAESVQAVAAARLPLVDPLAGDRGIIVTRASPVEPWVAAVREALEVPVFAAVRVGDEHALLVARLDELDGFFPRFVDADRDTLRSVAELVAAAVENTRLVGVRELQRFLPPSVAEGLIAGRLISDETPQRREVTLLSADMVGSTALAEAIDPDALAEVLNAFLRDVTTLAHAHGGTVGSVAGDGLLVIFGAPEPSEPRTHARQAVQAAFALRARIAKLSEEMSAKAPAGVHVRLGLNTGVCAVGVFGSDTQRTYTAIGMPANVAARLESQAAPGEILASASTLALVEGEVSTRPLPPLMLKGVSAPVAAAAIEPIGR